MKRKFLLAAFAFMPTVFATDSGRNLADITATLNIDDQGKALFSTSDGCSYRLCEGDTSLPADIPFVLRKEPYPKMDGLTFVSKKGAFYLEKARLQDYKAFHLNVSPRFDFYFAAYPDSIDGTAQTQFNFPKTVVSMEAMCLMGSNVAFESLEAFDERQVLVTFGGHPDESFKIGKAKYVGHFWKLSGNRVMPLSGNFFRCGNSFFDFDRMVPGNDEFESFLKIMPDSKDFTGFYKTDEVILHLKEMVEQVVPEEEREQMFEKIEADIMNEEGSIIVDKKPHYTARNKIEAVVSHVRSLLGETPVAVKPQSEVSKTSMVSGNVSNYEIIHQMTSELEAMLSKMTDTQFAVFYGKYVNKKGEELRVVTVSDPDRVVMKPYGEPRASSKYLARVKK